MKSVQLLEELKFHDKDPYAEPLFVAEDGRILRFALRPGQIVREHTAPHSPVYIVVLKGHGMFVSADGKEQPFGPNALLIYEAGEYHSARALDEDLVFVAFLHEAPGARSTETHQVGEKYHA
jgi:quercetin dioxygenase-like cupin family protein